MRRALIAARVERLRMLIRSASLCGCGRCAATVDASYATIESLVGQRLQGERGAA